MKTEFIKENKKKRFFPWLINKWHFWLLSIGWSIWSSLEEIINGYISEALGTIIFWVLMMTLIYFIIFSIKKSITRQVREEIKNKK